MSSLDVGKDWVDRTVFELWQEKPTIGVQELQIAVMKRCEAAHQNPTQIPANEGQDDNDILNSVRAPPDPSMITKARIKLAKAWIPYQEIANTEFSLSKSQQALVEEHVHKRMVLRAARQHKESDRLKQALETMGIEIDDHRKTWRVVKEPPSLDLLTEQPTNSCQAEISGISDTAATICKFCHKIFPSRNHVFKHLRDPTSGCGSAIFATGQKIDEAPSAIKAKSRREETMRRRGLRGKTACHATAENTLWVGDLPLSWTNPKKQFTYLRALLFHCIPRDVPTPWIKRVVRKAYRMGDKALYHGYAIVVFRDKDEAQSVLKMVDTQFVDPVQVFERQSGKVPGDLQSFSLKVRPAENGESASANWNNDDDTKPTHVVAGQDPPLRDQLRPLETAEIQRRIVELERRSTTSEVTKRKESTAEKSGADCIHIETEALLSQLCDLYAAEEGSRPIVRRSGRTVPQALCDKLLVTLQTLRWPARNERDGLAAERYLVLQSNVTSDRFYGELRDACRELMDWADAEYTYTGIAVTKNFVGSPHIDHRDQTFQYAISLGSFETGGELCVEGVDSSGNAFVNVVSTHNCMARVEGRHVHYVRSWDGGDRYSLIFYNTSEQHQTAILELGVDENYN